jgi:hypothetical protein
MSVRWVMPEAILERAVSRKDIGVNNEQKSFASRGLLGVLVVGAGVVHCANLRRLGFSKIRKQRYEYRHRTPV